MGPHLICCNINAVRAFAGEIQLNIILSYAFQRCLNFSKVIISHIPSVVFSAIHLFCFNKTTINPSCFSAGFSSYYCFPFAVVKSLQVFKSLSSDAPCCYANQLLFLCVCICFSMCLHLWCVSVLILFVFVCCACLVAGRFICSSDSSDSRLPIIQRGEGSTEETYDESYGDDRVYEDDEHSLSSDMYCWKTLTV